MGKGSPERRAILAGLSHIAADDKVQVLNENGRKVWVSRETLKGPKGKNYKPIKDKGEGDKEKGKKKPDQQLKTNLDNAVKHLKSDGDYDEAADYKEYMAKVDKAESTEDKLKLLDEAQDEMDEEIDQAGRQPVGDEFRDGLRRVDHALSMAKQWLNEQEGKKATDRKSLIRLASSMAVGSPERRVILAGLKSAGEYTEKEWKTHKQKHPGAKAENHTITKGDGKGDKDKGSAPDRGSPEYLDSLWNAEAKDLKSLTMTEETIEKAFSSSNTMSPKTVRQVLNRTEGKPLDEVFDTLDAAIDKYEDSGSGTIGAYHRSTAKFLKGVKKNIQKETGAKYEGGDFQAFSP